MLTCIFMSPCSCEEGWLVKLRSVSTLQVQTSANMSAEVHQVIQQSLLPWYGMLGNGSRTNAVIMGQGSSATA